MIFLTFLKLGFYSFGGPAAHLGYFHEEFVRRKQWLQESELGEIIALTQLLPGPGSSQTGFLIGVIRGGLWGGVQAWLGFTLPSAVLLTLFAAGVDFMRNPWAHAALDGLQLAAAAVVANAVRLMHRQLSPDLPRSILAVFSLIFVLSFPSSAAQLWAILLAGAVGALLWKQGALPASKLCLPISKRAAAASLLLFAILFVSVEALGRFSPARSVQVLRAFYQSGALVFGGGHVVLPLLQEAVVRPGWISESNFLAGYGAAQAIPGPLFTVAAYLGYLLPHPPNRVPGALLCLVGLFLPGLLLAFAVPPHWQKFQQHKRMRSAIAAINASVVGLLAAALVKILTAVSFHHPIDILLTAVDFVLLWRGQVSPLAIVLGSAAAMVLWARFLH